MKISSSKKEKIKEAIIHLLFENSPKALFTATIAQAIARDEEFVKRLLLELESQKLVVQLKKNSRGKSYKKRTRWLLEPKVYKTYKDLNKKLNQNDTKIA